MNADYLIRGLGAPDRKQRIVGNNKEIDDFNFNYCPLIWMFCGKDANVSINRVHKRALRIMWQDIAAPFAELLARGSECTIHIRNLQKLMLEIYINASIRKIHLSCGISSR